MRTTEVAEVVVVYDVTCPSCSTIARELPALLRVPVKVRSCRDPKLASAYPTLRHDVRTCAVPAVGIVRRDGSLRWWPGRTGAVGLLPVVRPRGLWAAVGLLWTALRVRPGNRRRRTVAPDRAADRANRIFRTRRKIRDGGRRAD